MKMETRLESNDKIHLNPSDSIKYKNLTTPNCCKDVENLHTLRAGEHIETTVLERQSIQSVFLVELKMHLA